MLNKIVPVLLCTVAPGALLAQQVELRSADEFISVEGEIVGFNGVMLSVETSVGQVSIPASEVICYGLGCVEIIDNNGFGLTAQAFDDVIAEEVVALEALSDVFLISFDTPSLSSIYRTVAGAFAVASQTTSRVELAATGQIVLQNEAGNETATLGLTTDGAASDINVSTVSLRGSAAAAFSGPVGWATAKQLPNQLLGLGAFAVVVAPNTGVEAISMEQLAGIYAGEVSNWSQLGGSDLNILPLQMPANSAVSDELIELVMEPAGKSIAGNVLTMADEASIATSVNQFPGSVSIVNIDSAQDNQTLAVAGSCGVATQATPFNILSGDYPLVRPIMVSYDRTPTTSLLTEVFDFASSDVAQNLLQREGFTNYSAVMQGTADKNTRLSQLLSASLDDTERPVAAQMFQVLFEAERLSATMSGGASSGPESAWNRAMMQDLAELLRDGEFRGKEVIFAGFGVSDDGSQAAMTASSEAASEMQAAFSQFAPEVILSGNLGLSSYGFGSVAPVTCYEGQVASATHTRVEVWIR